MLPADAQPETRAGLKTGEAQALPERCLARADGWLQIESVDPRLTHRTRPLPFARGAFDAWLRERAAAPTIDRAASWSLGRLSLTVLIAAEI